MAVSHGSTLHTDDNLAIRFRLHRPAFVRVENIDPRGQIAFESDLGRLTAVGTAFRIPQDTWDYMHLDSVIGTERVILMLSEAPLDRAAVDSLRSAVLLLDQSPVQPIKPARPTKKGAQAPPMRTDEGSSPYREADWSDRGFSPGPRSSYIEFEGGRRAATWTRFEHRPSRP